MGEGSLFSSLLRMVGSLIVVFGALFALRHYLLKKAPVTTVQGVMRVRERVHLGPRSQAVILDVAENSFLVCMSDNGISVTELQGLPQSHESQGTEHPTFPSHLRDALTLLKGRK